MATRTATATQINAVLKALPGSSFTRADLQSPKLRDAMAKAGLDPADHAASVKSYQRLVAAGASAEHAESMIARGLTSANHIARVPHAAFIATQAGALGLDQAQAEKIHRRATRIQNKTMHLWASVAGTVASQAYSTPMLDTVSPEVRKTFEQLPSYSDLFGTLDYCACEECRSIFGAAAYLVDLLRIIDEHVTALNKNTIPQELTFDSRRPDIAGIELTCANTNTLIPYLQVVNERLIDRAALTLGIKPTDAGKVLKQLATALVYPRALPFNSQIDQIVQLLKTAGAPYDDILRAWNAAETAAAPLTFNLSPEQAGYLTNAVTTAEAVAPFFNINAAKLAELKAPAELMARTGATYGGLIDLINQDLSNEEVAKQLQANFFLNQGLGGTLVQFQSGGANADVTIANIDNPVALDHVNRLLRLSDALGWSTIDTDWALHITAAPGKGPEITLDTLAALARLDRIAALLSLSPQAACPLLGPIKTYGQGADRAGSAFDRLFNPPALTARMGVYHPSGNPLNPTYTDTPLTWVPSDSTQANVAGLNRVLPGLAISIADAATLGTLLFGAKTKVDLDVAALSALYRHAVISRALQLPMISYAALLPQAKLGNPAAPTAADLLALIDLAQWMSSAGISPYTLAYVVDGTTSVYVNPLYRPATVDAWLGGLVKGIPDSGAPGAGDAIVTQIAVLFAASPSLIGLVLPIALGGVALPAGAATWQQAFLATTTTNGKVSPAHPDYVKDVLTRVSRWLVLQDALSLTEQQLASVGAYPVAYGLPDKTFSPVTVAAVRNIARVNAMMANYGDPQNNLLRYVMLASTGGSLDDQAGAVSSVTLWPADQVAALLDPKTGPAGALAVIAERLGRLTTCFQLIAALGANPDVMAGLVSLAGKPSADAWDTYTSTAAALLSKVAARYGEAWPQIFATLDGTLRTRTRDALLAYVLAQLNATYQDITTPNNVYEFLLVDVQMGPETQISYVKEALNAAQTYLQRCRLGLENGVIKLDIPATWWEWMLNYRVWEANREIFLYPENYLIPTLRKNPTPQCADLMSTLRQTAINKASVDAAFTSYMQGFSTVAQLRPVEVYRRATGTKDARIETTYLFACSNTTPNTFYYCSQSTGELWTAWQKIDLAINASYVAPVYAFGRLFIFWSEIKRTTSSSIVSVQGASVSSGTATYKITVQYSFLDESGKWIQPQTLVQDSVVLYEASGENAVAQAGSPLFAGLFDMQHAAWRQVFVFSTSSDSFAHPPALSQDGDRISVLYGPFIYALGLPVDLGSPPTTRDPDAVAFWRMLTDRMKAHNSVVLGEMSGAIPLGKMLVIDALLEDSTLLHRQEFPLVDPYAAATPLSWIGVQQPAALSQVQLVHDAAPISQNYLGGALPALSGAPRARTINAYSFISPAINTAQSGQIFTALKAANIVDAGGVIQVSALGTLDLAQVLAGITAFNGFNVDQYLDVQKTLFANLDSTVLFGATALNATVSVVKNQPGSFLLDNGDESFLIEPCALLPPPPPPAALNASSYIMSATPPDKPITADASQKIFETLQGYSLIDGNGHATAAATLQNLQVALGGLISVGTIAADQVPAILAVTLDPAAGTPPAPPVAPGGPAFVTLEEGLDVGPAPLGINSYVMSYIDPTTKATTKTVLAIDAPTSSRIFNSLQGYTIIDQRGLATSFATFGNVQVALQALITQNAIVPAQLQPILNVTLQSAFVTTDAFVGSNVTSDQSAQIWSALQLYSIIDGNGRVSPNLLQGSNVSTALSNMLLQGQVASTAIPTIYQQLATAATATSLRYANTGWAQGQTTTGVFQFKVTRMSTAAVAKLSRLLFVGGVDELLRLETQQIPVVPVLPFDRLSPSPTSIKWPAALDGTQVDFDGLYGQYFWEIFYHIPMLLAYQLTTGQQFQDAQGWQQRVFNPTKAEQLVTADVIVSATAQAISSQQAAGIVAQLQKHDIGVPLAPILSVTPVSGRVNPALTPTTDLSFLKTADPSLTDPDIAMVRNILLNYLLSAPASHYWQFFPFRSCTQQKLTDMLSDDNPAVMIYENDPFDPFAIARMRIGAFEKATVMQYIDNLIQWGDQLFAQDSWESITAATMLYVYASDVLGPRPQRVDECPGSQPATFADIRKEYASSTNGIPIFLIDLEHLVPETGDRAATPVTPVASHAFNDLNVYFCVSENDQLMRYWDTVADRLYKIEHSQNLQGQTRTLALFQPPLNPLDLIKAAMAGENVAAVAGAAAAPVWPYRFPAMLAEARALTGNVVELGGALLAALEKRDSEALSLLTNQQQGQLLQMITAMKQQAVVQAQNSIDALTIARQNAQSTADYFAKLISDGLIPSETTGLESLGASIAFDVISSALGVGASIALALPNVGSPFAMTYGGEQVGGALQAASQAMQVTASIAESISQRAQVMAGFTRRAADWINQQQTASLEVQNLDKQIAAATATLAIAQRDLGMHLTTIAQNKAMEDFLTSKFTSEELYEWMIGRFAALYYQTYNLALKSARAAQTSFQFETDSDATFLDFDYWSDAKRGLTAGESLRFALDQMDMVYRQGNTRRYEIEKMVSLAGTDPQALQNLKSTGTCIFKLTEAMFDYDYPGHYARKITSVSVSIPAVVAPYQTIKATLRQTKNQVVTQPSPDAVSFLLGQNQTQPSPSDLRTNWAVNQSIALSTGVDDSGMFVLDFHDERYLPFENTGAVSEWTLDLPLETNRFDLASIPDIIVTVRYTALFDGGLKTAVEGMLGKVPYCGGLYVDFVRMRNDAWYAAFADQSNAASQTLVMPFDPGQFGWFKSLNVIAVLVKLHTAPNVKIADGANFLSLAAPGQQGGAFTLAAQAGKLDQLNWTAGTVAGNWNFVFDLNNATIASLRTNGFVDPAKLTDLELIILYEGKVFGATGGGT